MKRILVIDDEQDFCLSLKDHLESVAEFEVFTCYESALALQQAQQLHPDLILLDVLMPKHSGLDIAEQLSKTPSTQAIPIVFLSAVGVPESVIQRKDWVGKPYVILKPVLLDELVRMIRTVIQLTEDKG